MPSCGAEPSSSRTRWARWAELMRCAMTISVPPRVDYSLTPLGRSLRGPVSVVGDWAIANREKIANARREFDEREE